MHAINLYGWGRSALSKLQYLLEYSEEMVLPNGFCLSDENTTIEIDNSSGNVLVSSPDHEGWLAITEGYTYAKSDFFLDVCYSSPYSGHEGTLEEFTNGKDYDLLNWNKSDQEWLFNLTEFNTEDVLKMFTAQLQESCKKFINIINDLSPSGRWNFLQEIIKSDNTSIESVSSFYNQALDSLKYWTEQGQIEIENGNELLDMIKESIDTIGVLMDD